jgi:prevent-host-death family protein
MRTWKIHEAKAKLSELLKEGAKEPQLIMNREKQVGVFINYEQFQEFQKWMEQTQRPTISDLIDDLEALGPLKKDLPDLKRKNRKNWWDK